LKQEFDQENYVYLCVLLVATIRLGPTRQNCARAETSGHDQLTSADVAALENAPENIGVQRKRLLIEKEELTELKEEMAEYKEDIEELKDFLDSSSTQQAPERRRLVLRESKAARRLFLFVNRMIHKLDGIVDCLEGRVERKTDDQGEKVAEIEDIVSTQMSVLHVSSVNCLQSVTPRPRLC
jgi:LETM1 and EF-hand domain-containing protein 1